MSIPQSNHARITTELRNAGCVFAEEEAQLLIAEASTKAELDGMVRQRVAGGRLEHILGWAEFYGRRVAVAPGVFVPRRRTEFLVRQAIALTPPEAVVIDLCCGSGALGLALATVVDHIELHASDIDPRAVRSARRNLATYGSRVYQGDLFNSLPPALLQRADVIVANVPYVPTEATELLSRDTRLNEPRESFDGGVDGLDILRRVAADAPRWLVPGGHLIVETGDSQALSAAAMFSQQGLTPRIARSKERNATIVIGTKPTLARQTVPPYFGASNSGSGINS